MTKPSPLSFAARLTHEQREELYLLLQTKTLAEGVAWCDEQGVKTSDSSLSEWLPKYRMIRRIEGFAGAADELAEKLAKRGVSPDLAPKLAQSVFLLQAAEAEDAETFATMTTIIQRHNELEAKKQQHADTIEIKRTQTKQRDRALAQVQRKLDHAERRVAALEEQAAATKKAAENAKAALKSGGMDEATRLRLMEEMDRMILGTNAAKAKKQEAA